MIMVMMLIVDRSQITYAQINIFFAWKDLFLRLFLVPTVSNIHLSSAQLSSYDNPFVLMFPLYIPPKKRTPTGNNNGSFCRLLNGFEYYLTGEETNI
jgi:hypothetical protein